jgi:uncharacterized protein (DUF3084 family)
MASDDANIIGIIRDLEKRIWTAKGRVKTQKEAVDDIISGHTAYNEATKAKQEYEYAKKKLELALQSDQEYNDAMEALAEEKQQLKDDRDILSLHLVEYYTTTHERQIEIGESNGDAREVIVTGKLGAKSKYQTQLFSKKGEQDDSTET